MAELESLFPPISQIIPSLKKLSHAGQNFWEDDPVVSKRMKVFLNSCLCVIHNLSKSSKHRDKFRTSKMKKTLDIYKGSPSLKRRMFSLLSISYVADPEVDMELLQDDYGVINDLTGILDETLSGKSTGFSIRELLEGLVNLSVNPINKEKIIDKSLPLFYAILEKCNDKELSLYVRKVLDELGFSDAQIASSTKEDKQETKKQDDDLCQSTEGGPPISSDDIQMLEKLHSILSESGDFGAVNVMEIIVTIKLYVSRKKGRVNVLKYMTKHNWPDLLLLVISNVWKTGNTAYLDSKRWLILENGIKIFEVYSNAGVEFADALIEHGVLDFMQQVADAYYEHLKQKVLSINAKNAAYRGEHVAYTIEKEESDQLIGMVSGKKCKDVVNKHAEADNNQAIGVASKKNVADNQQSTEMINEEKDRHKSTFMASNDVETEERPSDCVIDEYEDKTNDQPFAVNKKICTGRQIQEDVDTKEFNPPTAITNKDKVDLLKPTEVEGGGTADELRTSSLETLKIESSGSAALFTLKPVSEYAGVNEDYTVAFRQNSNVMINRAVFVSNQHIKSSQLFELNIDKIADKEGCSMEFGVCLYNTFPVDTFYTGSGYGEGKGFWFLRDNEFWKDFDPIGGGYKLNLRKIEVNDKIGLVKHPDGTMGFLYNGEYQGMAFRNIPEGVYILIAVTGRCLQVSISENTGNIIQKHDFSDVSRNEPLETFSFGTVGTNRMKLSKMRTPYGIDFIDGEKYPDIRKVYQSEDKTKESFIKSEKRLSKMYEINRKSTKGYLNENDTMHVINSLISTYKIYTNPETCVDPISNELIKLMTTHVILQGEVLKTFQKNNFPPDARFTFPKRLQQVFDVVRPCFDNIKDMSGIVWTGSTSEGFAIADNSGPGMPYVDDEMDLMIPLAIATEDLRLTTFANNTFEIPEGITDKNNVEIKLNNPEILITELEEIGQHQKSKKYPLFIWHPSCHPGYVTVAVTEHLQSYTSNEFLKHMCARSTPYGEDHLRLARSKLLEIQENYTRGRIKVAQSRIDKLQNDNEFSGQLRLVQEGPVQTISVRYQSQEPGGSVVEVDQTVDVAIALKGVNWPKIANQWITRERKWPEKSIVDKIITDGYHIVPKHYPGGAGVDLEWRLSFSVAERTLARSFTELQWKCYMVFKKLWRKYLKEPKVLSSYHMKTTMFWLCEKTSSDDWMSTNVGERILDLQNFLIHFLKQHNLPNYLFPRIT